MISYYSLKYSLSVFMNLLLYIVIILRIIFFFKYSYAIFFFLIFHVLTFFAFFRHVLTCKIDSKSTNTCILGVPGVTPRGFGRLPGCPGRPPETQRDPKNRSNIDFPPKNDFLTVDFRQFLCTMPFFTLLGRLYIDF